MKTPEESLEYPLTTVPLALANPTKDLWQGSKAILRKLLIEDADAFCEEPVEKSDWFIDGMAAVIIAVKTRDTWKEYANDFLKYCMPKDITKIRKLHIVLDSYRDSSIKQMIR